MRLPRLTFRQWVGWFGFALVFLLTAATAVWRGDILRAGLDPQVPFQTYTPPTAPDYGAPTSWVLRDARAPGAGDAAVFFVHSTTYEGGRHWNGPVGTAQGERWLREVVIPNYAGPFARAGAVSAPRYRQASLYTRLTLREDARDARAFAYRDIVAAFEAWLRRHPDGPIVLAGVEQGGELVARLVRERVAPDASLRARLAAVYLMDVVVAADGLSPAIPACERRDQAGCVVAFSPVGEDNDTPLSEVFAGEAVKPDDETSTHELVDRIAVGMEKLSAKHREILILRNVKNLSYEEIAVILNISVGTVKSRIARARESLRETLGEEFK